MSVDVTSRGQRPHWCVLYRILYDDGSRADCGARSWAATAEEAADRLRNLSMGPHGSIGLEVVAVLPWADEHYTRATAELFADLEGRR